MTYPSTWPKCMLCDRPRLDGHLTCGAASCSESQARELRDRERRLEIVARAIATVHFEKKQPYGIGTPAERVSYMVDRYWRNHVDHARAAIAAAELPQEKP